MENDSGLFEHMNETETDVAQGPLGFVPLVDTFPVILAVLIVAANGLGLLLFVRNHRLRNITNTFLVSLAISDLITGLFGIPFYLICSATHHMFCVTAALCWRFTTTSTILHLLTVTIDRYAAIVHAIRYHTIVTKTRATVSIFTMWVVSAFVSLIQLLLRFPSDDEMEGLSEEEKEEKTMQYMRAASVYQFVTLTAFFIVPLVFMIYSYVRIFNIVRYHEQQILRQNMPSSHSNSSRKQSLLDIPAQWKSAIVFLAMTFVYVVCWFPFFVYELREILDMFTLPHWAEYVFFYYPRFITSLTNPLFYIIGKHDFRKALCSGREKDSSTQMTSLVSRRRSSGSNV